MLSDKFAQDFEAELLGVASPSKKNRVAAPNVTSATMDAIKQMIIKQGLGPGDPLPSEAQLCESLGVSRSSVREAFRRLQALDIVRTHHGKGVFVADMSLRPMVETLVLRASVENGNKREALRQVVEVRKYLDLGIAQAVVDARKDKTNSDELHQLVEKMVEKASKGERFMEEDAAFHKGLIEGINNDFVQQLTRAIWVVHMALISDFEGVERDLLDTAKAHADMLTAAEEGDVERYRMMVMGHYVPLEYIINSQGVDKTKK